MKIWTRIKGTLHEDQFTFFIVSRSFILEMRNVSDKNCRENQNTHFVLVIFFIENRTVCEIMWKNVVERGRQKMTIWCMRIACWIPKTTNSHTHNMLHSLLFR